MFLNNPSYLGQPLSFNKAHAKMAKKFNYLLILKK